MMQIGFNNYETTKLIVQNPNMLNLLIVAIFACFSFLFLKKNVDSSRLLERTQTDQLKGVAVLFLVIGHFWVHVCQTQPTIILSADAVTFFLMLSGYGLMVSSENHTLCLRYYFSRRVKRVMFPYWIFTFFLIFLDYLVLKKVYPFKAIIMTLVGLNIDKSTWFIDYVRWYITFQLFWYIVFFLVFSKIGPSRGVITLFICGVIVFFFENYVAHLTWYQIFAFPFGCAMGHYHKHIKAFYMKYSGHLVFGAILVVLCVIGYRIRISSYISPLLPGLIVKFLGEINSILLCITLVIFISFLGLKNYHSSFLSFCGKICYEVFFLHAALLIKYNPIIRQDNLDLLPINFSILLLIILILSYFSCTIITTNV